MSSRSWSIGKSALFVAVALAAAALVNQMVGCMSAAAQDPTGVSVAAADELIERMSLEAGAIFAGRVTAVRRPAGFAGAAEATVEIDFLVDEAVRGAATGSVYTLREWAGVWTGNAQRYWPGQRLFMFLYTPVEGGFGSTVHGPEGAIPLRGAGRAPGPDDSDDAAAEMAVDLRWVLAQVAAIRGEHWVEVGDPLHDGGAGQGWRLSHGIRSEETFEAMRQGPRLVQAPTGPWTVEPAMAELPMQPLSQVLELCRRSVRIRDAAR